MPEQQKPNRRQLYSIEDAAQQLGGMSPWTLRKHIARGTCRQVRVGRRVMVPQSEIDRIARRGLPSLAGEAERGA